MQLELHAGAQGSDCGTAGPNSRKTGRGMCYLWEQGPQLVLDRSLLSNPHSAGHTGLHHLYSDSAPNRAGLSRAEKSSTPLLFKITQPNSSRCAIIEVDCDIFHFLQGEG